MLSIRSKPDTLNYSLSLPPIEVASTQAQVTVKLLDGTTEIIEENYSPLNLFTYLVLKYSLLIDDLLTIDRPKDDLVTVHEQGCRTFTVRISDADMTVNLAFKVIKGFYYRQPIDLEFITATNWLNIALLPQTVRTHQPVYLTAYPDEAATVKVDCVFEDNTTALLTYATLQALKLQTVDVSAYLVQRNSTKKLKQYTVYAVNSANKIILRKQVFVVEQYNHVVDEFFIFQNRLGGFDSLVMSGEQKETFKNETSTAIMQEEYIVEYAGTLSRSVKKNTGYIQSRQHRQLLIDFIFSKQRYHLLDGAFRAINLKDPAIDPTKNALNDFDIEFSYQDTMLAYPYIVQAPNFLKL